MVKKYFIYTSRDSSELGVFKDVIDGIILNGNVFAHNKRNIKEKIIGYGYHTLIDPMIYVLQTQVKHQMNRTNEGNFIKPSIVKMLKSYSLDILNKEVSLVDHKKTLYDFFKISSMNIKKVLEKIKELEFEINGVKIKSTFMKFLKDPKIKNCFMAPQFIPQEEEFIERNKNILSIQKFDVIPLYIDKKSYSSKNYIDMIKIISEKQNGSEVIVWIENNINKKKGFNEIITQIIKNNIKNISFRYANFSQMIICQDNDIKINKWINAFGYGEERNILPIGGGLPVNKVYSPIEHVRHTFEEFMTEISQFKNSKDNYLNNYCGCKMCVKLLGQSKNLEPLYMFSEYNIAKNKRFFATPKAQKLSTRHFVYNKVLETSFYDEIKFTENINLWKEIKKKEE